MTGLVVPITGPHAGLVCLRTPDGPVPLPPVTDSATAPPAVALPAPPEPETGVGIEVMGEPAPWVDTRGNRRRLEESIVRHHGEDYRGWARAKAAAATTGWTRGVRDGSIPLPKRS